MRKTLLGLDIGSSSVKVALVNAETGERIACSQSPETELPIDSPQLSWAEQDPEVWWHHVQLAVQAVRHQVPDAYRGVVAIGIAYQMHGLVLIDEEYFPIRPSIIWCDSRAVASGKTLESRLSADDIRAIGNSPGNFTAAKLYWVKENEPEIYARARYMLLPGEYIALRLTGEVGTTPSGLSEATLWNYETGKPAHAVFKAGGLRQDLMPPLAPNVGSFACIAPEVAELLSLSPEVVVAYRAGDQPNNALALNVLEPGTAAANAGTSAVLYSVSDSLAHYPDGSVNNFLHVNSTREHERIGALACINGAGSFYRWLRESLFPNASYDELNEIAERSPIGSGGVIALPYGNGAERTLGNKNIFASFSGIDFNRTGAPDLVRAAHEAIAFSLCYAAELSNQSSRPLSLIRAGNTNMFQSSIFRDTFATVTGANVELYDTDGATGAAYGAGIGAGVCRYDILANQTPLEVVAPQLQMEGALHEAYEQWKGRLSQYL